VHVVGAAAGYHRRQRRLQLAALHALLCAFLFVLKHDFPRTCSRVAVRNDDDVVCAGWAQGGGEQAGAGW
jgi:hypothetical protein